MRIFWKKAVKSPQRQGICTPKILDGLQRLGTSPQIPALLLLLIDINLSK